MNFNVLSLVFNQNFEPCTEFPPCVSKHIYVDFLHCIPNSLFEFIKFKHWCFKNLVFDVTPNKEIKWGYLRASRRPAYWTTSPNPSVLECPVKGFSYPQSPMYQTAILLKYQLWYYSKLVSGTRSCETKNLNRWMRSKFLGFGLNDYVR